MKIIYLKILFIHSGSVFTNFLVLQKPLHCYNSSEVAAEPFQW